MHCMTLQLHAIAINISVYLVRRHTCYDLTTLAYFEFEHYMHGIAKCGQYTQDQ